MTMIFILLLIILQLNFFNGADIVVYPTVGANWTTTTFIIPTQNHGRNFWSMCSKQSKFYCLSAYETDEDDVKRAVAISVSNFSVPPRELDSHQKFSILRHNAYRAAEKAFLPMYQKHNFFAGQNGGCCVQQYNIYYRHGLQTLKILPEFYVFKMTDYSEDNKNLNLIWSYFLEDCDVNIITKLGFGKGRLVRNHLKSGLDSHNLSWLFSLEWPKLSNFWSKFVLISFQFCYFSQN